MKNRVYSALIAMGLVGTSSAVLAQSSSFHVDMNYDFALDCSQPIVTSNYVTHVTGRGVLNADRSASADLVAQGSLNSSQIHFEARLGGAPGAGPGGTTSTIRVLGRNQLQLIWSQPHHDDIVNVKTSGRKCQLSYTTHLRPGYSNYQIFYGQGFATCRKPVFLGGSCRAY